MSKKLVDPHYAKGGEYQRVMVEIQKARVCPLCHMRWHKNPILRRKGGWFITKSTGPYQNADHHFLVIGKRHRESLDTLSANDFRDAIFLMRWAVRTFKIRGGAIALRFGDTRFTGATICHLHFHLIVPKLDRKKKRARLVQFPVG